MSHPLYHFYISLLPEVQLTQIFTKRWRKRNIKYLIIYFIIEFYYNFFMQYLQLKYHHNYIGKKYYHNKKTTTEGDFIAEAFYRNHTCSSMKSCP